MVKRTYLVTDDQRLALRVPGQRESVTQALDLVDTILGTHIPELYYAVIANTAKLSVFYWVEGDFLDRGGMAFELSGVAYEGLLGVPFRPKYQH